ncbi:hypothetical protein BHE74_00018787 [Ensete ventricosum]|nr:hypothetical protein BHE74_00018787 [Ensete ventricosum]
MRIQLSPNLLCPKLELHFVSSITLICMSQMLVNVLATFSKMGLVCLLMPWKQGMNLLGMKKVVVARAPHFEMPRLSTEPIAEKPMSVKVEPSPRLTSAHLEAKAKVLSG